MNRPSILDGSNYDYWKPRIISFLKSLHNRAWKVVLKGWKHPIKLGENGEPTSELKPEKYWSKEEDEIALGNSKALNAIFNGIDNNIFIYP